MFIKKKGGIHGGEYKTCLADIKTRVRNAQLKAAVKVNSALLNLYWELGADIVSKQAYAKWGDRLLLQLSKDLVAEFPNAQGFSHRNLKYVKQWYAFYSGISPSGQQAVTQIGQQAVAQLVQQPFALIKPQPIPETLHIPWGHNITIITKCKNPDEALYYARETITHSWSRSVLTHQIESGLYKRRGKAISNFSATLPKLQSDLAEQTLKDPYVFDFLAITGEYKEQELENALVERVTQFLLELGSGFAYLGRQVPLQVGSREFFLDLLFYHARLHCYVVVELKTVDFEPEHAGKLNFYLKAVDARLRGRQDNPAIGILICKSKDKVVVEYALSDIKKPIGVSAYRLTQALPSRLKASLPGISDMEEELAPKGDTL